MRRWFRSVVFNKIGNLETAERGLWPKVGTLETVVHSSNFRRLVLSCIDADFRNQILVGKLLTRSTNSTLFARPKFSKFVKISRFSAKKIVKKLSKFSWKIEKIAEKAFPKLRLSVTVRAAARQRRAVPWSEARTTGAACDRPANPGCRFSKFSKWKYKNPPRYQSIEYSQSIKICLFSEIFRKLVRRILAFSGSLTRFLQIIRVDREKCRKIAKSAQKSASIQPIFWYFKALRRILILWWYFGTLALCKIKVKIQDVLLENLQPVALLRRLESADEDLRNVAWLQIFK